MINSITTHVNEEKKKNDRIRDTGRRKKTKYDLKQDITMSHLRCFFILKKILILTPMDRFIVVNEGRVDTVKKKQQGSIRTLFQHKT
jgi:hypothetical protein